MEYRRLGRTNLKVSAIGLGTIPLIDVEEKEAIKVIRRAIELGINFIDAAQAYKTIEEKLAKALKGVNKEVYICTKSVITTEKEAIEAVEKSLKSLEIETIDVFMIHDGASAFASTRKNYGIRKDNIEPYFGEKMAVEGLKKMQREGKIKFLGISLHGTPEVMKRAIESGEFDVIEVAYNLINRTAGGGWASHWGEEQGRTQKEIFPLAYKNDIGLVIMKPLCGGLLGRPSEQLIKILNGRVKTSAELALKFILANKEVSTVIPGVKNIQELEEDVKAGEDIEKINEQELKEILSIVGKLGKDFCRGCGYCLPCRQGIIIRDVLNILNYYTLYGSKEWAEQQYKRLSVKPDACIECGECEEKCPYSLPIREMLKKTVFLFGK